MRRSGWQIGALLASVLAVAAAGCTGTDFLDSGNSQVRIELVPTGELAGEWDCLTFEIDDVKYRPLRGVCGPDSSNEGDLCFHRTDCLPGSGTGTCIGSYAEELLGIDGITAVDALQSEKGNLLPGPCQPENQAFLHVYPTLPCDEFVNPPGIILSEELYEIGTFTIKNVALYKDDPVNANVGWRLCLNNDVSVSDILGDALRFNVVPGQDKVLRFELHVDVLEEKFQPKSANNCPVLRDNLADILVCTTCDGGTAP